MSYHHFQRVWDHLEAIKDKGKQTKFSGAHRHEKLSGIALALLYALAELTDPRTGTCSYSVRQIVDKTKRTSAGIRAGLDELVEWGIYERERSSRRKKFTYRLKLECPPDCQKLELHNPPGQIPKFESANKQHTQTEAPDTERAISLPTERANSQLSDVLSTSPLKENKETKKKVSPCSFCRVDPESIAGKFRQIHAREDCRVYRSLKEGGLWQVAVRKFGEEKWAGLSIKDQQREYWRDVAEWQTQNQIKLEAKDLETKKREEKLDLLIAGDPISPNWRIWLSVRFREVPERIGEDLATAKKYSALGEDLELSIAELGGTWWSGSLAPEVMN